MRVHMARPPRHSSSTRCVHGCCRSRVNISGRVMERMAPDASAADPASRMPCAWFRSGGAVAACRALFADALPEELVEEIRRHLQQQQAPGAAAPRGQGGPVRRTARRCRSGARESAYQGIFAFTSRSSATVSVIGMNGLPDTNRAWNSPFFTTTSFKPQTLMSLEPRPSFAPG